MSLEDNMNEYLKQYAVVKEIKEKLDGQDKEIERLKEENDRLEDFNEELMEERNRLNNIIKEVRENVKGIKEINNEVYKQTDMLESFYSRKWCEDITNELLEILDKGE